MTAMKLLIASALLVHLVAASPQVRFPLDGHSSTPVKAQPHAQVRRHHQVPMKLNHTKTEKNVEPVLPSDSGIANIIRTTRQVSDNSVLSQFPRIYKVDDFIIIANPKVKTPPPPCTPQPVVCPLPPKPSDILDEENGFRMGARPDGTDTQPTSDEPSKCVWAIVACCSPGSRKIRYSCFELLGCPGAFWDVNPCDEKVVMAAANRALQFYASNSTTQ